MLLIQQITKDPLQKLSLVLEDGSLVKLEIYFRPLQLGWFFNSIEYGDFVLRGLRITNSPNMLYQWMNKISFGISCFTTNLREPSLIEDFASGNSRLYILTEDECVAYREYLQSG